MKAIVAPAALLLWWIGFVPAPGAQDKTQAEVREVRIYLLDRVSPDRALKDSVAVLTVERRGGRGTSYLLPRVEKAAALSAEAAPGPIRGLLGSPYFVELVVGEGWPAPARGGTPRQDPAPGPGQDEVRER